MIVSLTIAVATMFGLASTTMKIIDRQRAQLAADASALACVISGFDGSRDMALANKSQLISVKLDHGICQVVVKYRGLVRDAFALKSVGN